MATVKDQLEKLSKQKHNLAARRDQIDLFNELLHTSRLERNILLLYGLGRVGKTVLLAHFWSMCAKDKIPVAAIDGVEQRSILDALETLRQQIPSGRIFGRYCKTFDDRWDRTQKLRRKLEEKSGQSVLGVVISSGLNVGIEASVQKGVQLAVTASSGLSSMSFAGVGAVLGAMGGALGGEITGRALGAFRQHGLSQKDAEFLLRSEILLTEELAAAINELGGEHRVVILIDSYEHFEEIKGMDFWIRDELLVRLDNERTVVVIAGRYRLTDPRWEAWSARIHQVELSMSG